MEAPHTTSHYFHIDCFKIFPYSFLLDFYQIVKERRLEPPTQFPTISLTPPPHQHPHMCVFKYIQMSLVHHNHYPHHMHHDSSSKYLLFDSLSKYLGVPQRAGGSPRRNQYIYKKKITKNQENQENR